MIKSRVIRITAAAVTSVGLVAGMAGMVGASSGTIGGTTGPMSENKIISASKTDTSLTNHNTLSLSSGVTQGATTGDAKTSLNSNAGGATTGDAANNSTLTGTVTIANPMPVMGVSEGGGNSGTIDGTTGPQSTNVIVNKDSSAVSVTNDNTISLSTETSQSANSGDAKVHDNTIGGSATTGDATNTSTSTFTLTVTN